jgi:hypothetical protein
MTKGLDIKRILFLLCKNPIVSVLSLSISSLSLFNLKKGLERLESGAYDFFFVSLEEIDDAEKDYALNCVQQMVDLLDEKTGNNVYISCSSRSFEESFADYISQIEAEVRVDVIGGINEQADLKMRINSAILQHPGAAPPFRRMPTVFMS